ncbi:MAG TPA: M1 family peptidase, partial [Gemmatimonadaceae bacterium]|nr:M1 family peptidase [Gemmatimonadaceae bacterium]
MSARLLRASAFALLTIAPLFGCAQATATAPATQIQPVSTTAAPERAVRRTLPMQNMISRAFAEGTRDSSGRPGRNYWQVWTDYKINARLDSATS